MTETPSGFTQPPRGSRRLIWGLGAALVVVLVALAGAIGFIVADSNGGSNESAAPAAAISSSPTARAETTTSTFALPTQLRRDLRTTVEAMTADGNAIVASGNEEGFKVLLKEYATPECEALILGVLAAFGDEGTSDDVDGTSTIVSVVENGDTGTAVLRDDLTGEEEHEDWVRGDDGWRMTCELEFDDEASDAPVEVETTTAEPAPALGDSCTARGETADNNHMICIQGTWVGVAYPNVEPGSPCEVDGSDGLDPNGKNVLCREGTWTYS